MKTKAEALDLNLRHEFPVRGYHLGSVSSTWKLLRAARRSASVHDGEPLSGMETDIQ